MKVLSRLIVGTMTIVLTACGGSSSSSSSSDNTNGPDNPSSVVKDWPIDKPAVACVDNSNNPVNWEVALQGDAETLSEYSLFSNTCNPTVAHSDRSLPYELFTTLFTDYATKYRLVYIPDGKTVEYNEQEALDFPVGSVIAKTFTMPKDTSRRVFEDELLIETRLLILQEDGWIARAYIWNESGTEAYLSAVGGDVDIDNLIHHGEKLPAFTYSVPTESQCTECHQFTPNKNTSNALPTEFRPLGPKARYLNSDYVYEDGKQNQLLKWQEKGFLTGLPEQLADVQKVISFNDDMSLSDYGSNLEETVKSWLDINCAHCHRPEGQAGNTGFKADFNVPFSNKSYHGICQVPVSGASSGSSKIIVPGNPESSLLYNRLRATKATTDTTPMPPIGRALTHAEGTTLIYEWIKNMADAGACQ